MEDAQGTLGFHGTPVEKHWANQSDVLKTMLLSKNWSENQEDTLKIEGFKPDVVEKVNFNIIFKGK